MAAGDDSVILRGGDELQARLNFSLGYNTLKTSQFIVNAPPYHTSKLRLIRVQYFHLSALFLQVLR